MVRATRSTLPQKRQTNNEDDEMSPVTKKSKAELRRQSLSKAREWATERKRKNDGDDLDVKKSSKKKAVVDESSDEDDEARDIVVPMTTRKGTRGRRRGTSKVVAAALAVDVNDDVSEAGTDATMPLDDTSSIGSTRRSSRRRTAATTTKKSATVPKTAAKKAPARRGGRRKVVSPVVVEEQPELQCDKEEEEVKVQEDVKEETTVKSEEVVVEESEAKKEVTEEIESVQEETTKQETNVESKEVVTTKNESTEQTTSMMAILFSLTPVFFQGLVIQWTLAYSVILTFCFDWWVWHGTGKVVNIQEFGPMEEVEAMIEDQRDLCMIFGFWLITIVGYSILFGANNRAGWIVTGAVYTMVSFAAKMLTSGSNGRISVPSLPIYSYSGFDITVPDLLAVLSMVGCISVLLQPVVPTQRQP